MMRALNRNGEGHLAGWDEVGKVAEASLDGNSSSREATPEKGHQIHVTACQ